MTEKNKSGAGKFFLGALLGGIAGAIAGKFIKVNPDSGEELEDAEESHCNCDNCECDKKSTTKEKPAAKKSVKKQCFEGYPEVMAVDEWSKDLSPQSVFFCAIILSL